MQPTPSPVNLNDPTLLSRSFSKFHELKRKADRWDKQALHSSDLYDCARKVWARRNDMPQLVHDDATVRKMQIGTDFENQVADAYAARLAETNVTFERQVELHGLNDNSDVVGHPDFVLRQGNEVQGTEIKTTTFFVNGYGKNRKRIVPTEPKMGYRVQAAANGIALKAKNARIYVVCRDTGMEAEFMIQVEQYEPLVRAQYALMNNLTQIGMPEPVDQLPPRSEFDVKTGTSWMCKYCQYSGCERNTNPAALEVPA